MDALLDVLRRGHRPKDTLNRGGLFPDLTKRLVERALDGEMTDHLGYEKQAYEGRDVNNSRNGTTRELTKPDQGEFKIEFPRDRDGRFEPKLVTVPTAEYSSHPPLRE